MGWYGQDCGSSHDSSSIFLIYFPFSSFTIPVSQLLVSLPLTGPIIPVAALRAPKLSLVLD